MCYFFEIKNYRLLEMKVEILSDYVLIKTLMFHVVL